jgi:hypothetical protein
MKAIEAGLATALIAAFMVLMGFVGWVENLGM